MKTTTRWSKPYYGIQHLEDLKVGFQITVTNRGLFAECDVKIPGLGWEGDKMFDTTAEAIAYGESRATNVAGFR